MSSSKNELAGADVTAHAARHLDFGTFAENRNHELTRW